MKRKSTTTSDQAAGTFEALLDRAVEAPTGSPRQSTLRLIRQFARAYHFERGISIPSGMILN